MKVTKTEKLNVIKIIIKKSIKLTSEVFGNEIFDWP